MLPYLTPQYEFSKVFHGNVVMPCQNSVQILNPFFAGYQSILFSVLNS